MIKMIKGSFRKSLKDIFKMFMNIKLWLLIPKYAFISAFYSFITVDLTKVFLHYQIE